MAYLMGAGRWREVAASVWLMLIGAGLLATSAPKGDGDPVLPVWSGPGPSFALSSTEPTQAFAVTFLVPKVPEATWSVPEFARLDLSVSADHGEAGGTTAEGGAAPTPVDESPPLSSVTLRDSTGMILLESTPFLGAWGTTTDVALLGDCAAPDQAAADPCRLSFSVEFERSPSGSPAQTEYSWSMSVSTGAGAEPRALWTAEIEPL